jgi:hypothetical protein
MTREYKNWLEGYYQYTRHSESPDLFHFWTGVSTIAGALRRQVWIDERFFQWTPNFYIIMVGPAGIVAKSTSSRIGMKLLEKVDGVIFGPKSMTWQGLTLALEEAQTMIPIGNGGDMLNMAAITCSVSELGTFLRPSDRELVDVIVDLWDGQLETWKRKLKGPGDTNIENPWINVIACTTPSWLQDNYPEALIGGGLTSRIVFVYGDTKRHLVPYPSDAVAADTFSDEGEKLIHDLRLIAEMKGEYKLDNKGKAWGIDWYKNHWQSRPEHMASERYSGYIARKQSHIHKLAIVVAASQRKELIITEADLIIADNMTSGLEKSMGKVFKSLGVGDEGRRVNEIMAYIRAYTTISQIALWRYMLPIMSEREFGEATSAAIKAGFIKLENGKYTLTPENWKGKKGN